ncbi:MAG TPA: hypothetical protein VHZ03_23080 [Trebonia sp.]|nr:hypothetical protein [Trebonia sp.]
MSDDAEAAAGDVEARHALKGLAYMCAHMDEISTVLADPPGGEGTEALERLRSALLGNKEISGPLSDIHHALLRAGDALGVYGNVRGLGLALAGVDTSEPLEIVYRCPAGRCSRIVPGPARTPPRCEVAGEALRWGQL